MIWTNVLAEVWRLWQSKRGRCTMPRNVMMLAWEKSVMPQRTNPFQQLIATIYRQLAAIDGATVVESEMRFEEASGTERETDVLIEKSVAGFTIRIALECRDHKRTSEVGWIEQLDGKYRNRDDINKVVAVSSSGFTESAQRKANVLGIETRTLKEAEETDWANELAKFIRPGMLVVESYHTFVKANFHCQPADSSLAPQDLVYLKGEYVGQLEEFIMEVFKKVAAQIERYWRENLRRHFPTATDLRAADEAFVTVGPFPLDGLVVVRNDCQVALESVEFVAKTTFRHYPATATHRALCDSQAVASEFVLKHPGKEFQATVIQIASRPNSATVTFRSNPPAQEPDSPDSPDATNNAGGT